MLSAFWYLRGPLLFYTGRRRRTGIATVKQRRADKDGEEKSDDIHTGHKQDGMQ